MPRARLRWWPWLLLALLLAGGGLLWRQHAAVSREAASLYQERDENELPPIDPAAQAALKPVAPPQGSAQAPRPYRRAAPTAAQRRGRIRILIVGTDQTHLGRGRSDVIMVVLLDPARQQLSLLSVPRDLLLNIPGYGMHKVNAAYSYGGVSLSARTLETYFGVPFDYYFEISQGGFQTVIRALGGVDVTVPFNFVIDGAQFTKGPAHLNPDQALAYVRMRKGDPRGDAGRQDRQQEVIGHLLQGLSKLSAQDLDRLLQSLKGDLRTDLSPSELLSLRADHPYALSPDRRRQLTLAGQGQRIGGVWYDTVSDAERRRLYLILR